MLKLNFLHTIYSNPCLFCVAFPDVFIKVFILCLLCLNMDNKFIPILIRRGVSPCCLSMDQFPTCRWLN